MVSRVVFAVLSAAAVYLSTALSPPLPLLPCRGQMFINGSFHVGRFTSKSFRVYRYDQEFWNNENDLECCFNEGSIFNWKIDRVDIISSGGLVCLGGGLGFPWYKFKLYGRNFSHFHADLWVSWRGAPQILPASPVNLIQCYDKGIDTVVL